MLGNVEGNAVIYYKTMPSVERIKSLHKMLPVHC